MRRPIIDHRGPNIDHPNIPQANTHRCFWWSSERPIIDAWKDSAIVKICSSLVASFSSQKKEEIVKL